MKAVVIKDSFGIESLTLVELPEPGETTPGQVMVKIHATSLNYRDWMMVGGLYNPKQPLPLVPLSDGAGEIVAVGEGVTQWKAGDRVAGIFAQDWQSGPFLHAYWQSS